MLSSNYNVNELDIFWNECNDNNDEVFCFDESQSQTEFHLYSDEENSSIEEDLVDPSLDSDGFNGCNVKWTIVQNFHGGSPELDCLVELYTILDKRGVANSMFDELQNGHG